MTAQLEVLRGVERWALTEKCRGKRKIIDFQCSKLWLPVFEGKLIEK